MSHRLAGVPGNDVHPADAAPSLPQPAAGSDPAEAAGPHAPAGTHLATTITTNKPNSWRIIVWRTITDKNCMFMQVNAEIVSQDSL